MTAEAVIAAQPDVIVVFTAGLESIGGLEGLRKLPGVMQTLPVRTAGWWPSTTCTWAVLGLGRGGLRWICLWELMNAAGFISLEPRSR